ncbi:MAG TPA: undecaprenyldiphospho-muramoylpentapeptide beta-N-acetylglucosaminyltransferase [Myxococcaceae bacterium]|nr:undecaprenyldiphospho-muramoylpentapeptide beta-N-acetylglucosaminyltransferase [Myxococcaceae bacterium]
MRMLIAGGGTGGHLFPGIALAEEVTTRHPDNRVLFVGTTRGLEARVVPAAGFLLETIEVRGLKGKGALKALKALLLLPLSFVSSWRILGRFRPDVVVGVGGYASGPVVLAAWMRGIATAIQEQNALPGITNRILARIVRAVFIAFEQARAAFPPRKTFLVGNPVRRKLMDNYLRSRPPGTDGRFRLLVVGGSLGARGLNNRMLEALPHLGDLRERMDIVHQTGAADVEAVKAGYAAAGVSAEVVPFVDDMSAAYARASLVLCRAGATTVAELTICKKAAILVPFPFATDDHQAVNAAALVEAGAALVFRESELGGERLAQELRRLAADPERLQRMERAAGGLGRPEAARELVDLCTELVAPPARRGHMVPR